MSWDMTNLNEVVDTAKPDISPVAEGTYRLRLLEAKVDTYNPTALALDFAIDEGGFKGRRIFPTIPDPGKYTWAAGAAKKLAHALGVTQNPGEGVIEMFHRAATTGNAVVNAQVTVENYSKRDGTPASKNNVQLFSFEATA